MKIIESYTGIIDGCGAKITLLDDLGQFQIRIDQANPSGKLTRFETKTFESEAIARNNLVFLKKFTKFE